MFAPICAQCNRAACFAAGFFETKGAQSMVRAVALLCGLAAFVCSLGAYGLTQRPHVTAEHVAMIGKLAELASVFIVGGAVALLTRTKSNAATPEAP